MRIPKTWTGIDRLFDLSNKIKQDFLKTEAVSVLLYRYITWTLMQHKEEKLDCNFKGMVGAV